MPKIESPCLSCDLKDCSKDNPICKECDARCDYVRVLGGGVPSTLIRPIYKKASTAKLKQAELYIQEYCEKRFIELEDLKSRRFSGGLSDARADIAYKLRHKYVLSLKDIGKLLGKTQQAISVILKPKVVTPASFNLSSKLSSTISPTSTNTIDKSPPDDRPQVVERPKHTKSAPKEEGGFICISFADHPDLYERLLETAKANFRKPEDHILYLIDKEREGIHENKNIIPAGTQSP